MIDFLVKAGIITIAIALALAMIGVILFLAGYILQEVL